MPFFGLFGDKHKASEVEEVIEPKQPAILHFRDVPKEDAAIEPGTFYPMRHDPIPVVSVDYVLSTQAKLIQEIKRAVPISEEEKDAYLFPVIRNLAAYTHLLPASSSHHHSGRGGLFRHSLEVGLYTVNRARTHIFDQGENPDVRHKNRGRWFVACCVAGLLHDSGKMLVNMIVSGDSGRTLWRPSTEPLATWAERENLKEYYVSWLANTVDYEQHEWSGATLYWALVPELTRLYIESSNSIRMMTDLYDSLAGITRNGKLISNLVKNADMASVHDDVIRTMEDGKIRHGVDTPIASIIENIIADLIEQGKWVVNGAKKGKDTHLWVTNKGLFIDWEAAFPSIIKEINERKIDYIVADPQIIAERLCEGKLCEFVDPAMGAQIFWKVLPIDTVKPKVVKKVDKETGEITRKFLNADGGDYQYKFINCLKLANEDRFFEKISRPAKVLTVVMTEEMSQSEVEAWKARCHMDPPETQPNSSFAFTEELEKEAETYAARERALSYFDEYGNPIRPTPSFTEEDWNNAIPKPPVEEAPVEENTSYLDTLAEETQKDWVDGPEIQEEIITESEKAEALDDDEELDHPSDEYDESPDEEDLPDLDSDSTDVEDGPDDPDMIDDSALAMLSEDPGEDYDTDDSEDDDEKEQQEPPKESKSFDLNTFKGKTQTSEQAEDSAAARPKSFVMSEFMTTTSKKTTEEPKREPVTAEVKKADKEGEQAQQSQPEQQTVEEPAQSAASVSEESGSKKKRRRSRKKKTIEVVIPPDEIKVPDDLKPTQDKPKRKYKKRDKQDIHPMIEEKKTEPTEALWALVDKIDAQFKAQEGDLLEKFRIEDGMAISRLDPILKALPKQSPLAHFSQKALASGFICDEKAGLIKRKVTNE